MKNWWCIWESRLPIALCEDIQKMAAEIAENTALVGNRNIETKDGKAIEDSRRSRIKFFDYTNVKHKVMFDLVFDHAIAANRSSFGFDIDKVIDVQYTKYLAEEKGFYNWHDDVTWCSPNLFHRKLSFTAQLSDPSSYEGGDLLFDLPKELCPPAEALRKQGTVIIFPSFLRHMVSPVTKGERHSMVSWIEGLCFR